MPSPSLLQRLKERKLVQWALAYLAGAFVVFQAIEVLAEPWGISPTIQRGVHIVLLAGLLIALVLAWYHGEKGRQRVSGPELLIVAVLLILGGVTLSLVGEAPASELRSPLRDGDNRPGIAVLPCANMSTAPEDEYLSAALHDEILLQLQKISSLFSIGRTSVLKYSVDPPSTSEIASALGVGFIGECSVQKYGNQIRLIFQLLDGRSGGQLWAQDYDRDLSAGNLFAIQSDIARQVASSMRAVLTPEEQARVDSRPTENLEAYDHYLIARSHLNERNDTGFAEAIDHFREAIQADSAFAQAYVGLAESYVLLAAYDLRVPIEVLGEANTALSKALEIDDGLPEAHATLGLIRLLEWDWPGSEVEFTRAIELLPGYAPAHHWYGLYLIVMGNTEQALREIRQAQHLDPLSPVIATEVGLPAYFAGQFDQALGHFQNAIEMNPSFIAAHSWAGLAQAEIGSFDEAVSECQTAVDLSGRSPRWLADLAFVYAVAEEDERAIEIVRELEQMAHEQYVSPTLFAAVYGELGELDQALAWLEKAYQDRSYLLTRLATDPRFHSLRGESEFQALLQRMGLD
jgi:TolB-like protein/Flp pilus assembly protein TadD